ncbi:hypothetical protein [Pantoea vagans]|uniref:hypothetical protein n=1 Tax=Pantoea vagans TaxID=470934 RepID=UPI00320804C5
MSTLRVDALSSTDNTRLVLVKDLLSDESDVPSSIVHMPSPDGRTLAEWSSDFNSVKKWVKGDGVTDDTVAFQEALDSGASHLHIPAGTSIYLSAAVTLPAGSFTLSGEGTSSVITGPASTLIKFAATPESGYPVTEIYGVKFAPSSNDAIHVDMTSVWSSAGKPPHIVRDCYFQYAGTGQVGIRMNGVWAARITHNTFMGAGTLDAKTGNTGYGIKTLHTDDMSSSVMNVQILSNTFTVLSYPIFLTKRTLLTGGRCEGIKISGNNCVNGTTGITAFQTLAISITGNQVSDYVNAIILEGCFDTAITGNSEITGDENCIYLSSKSDSFCERVSITGNTINVQKVAGTSIRISNTDGTGYCRNLTIASNDIRGIGTDSTYGIFAAGSYAITNVVVSGNNFIDHSYGVFFGGIDTTGANTDWDISGNGFSLNANGIAVRFPQRISPRIYYRHSATSSFTATASQSTVSIDVSAAGFLEVPVYAKADLTTQTGVRLVYSYDTSTTTNLSFNVVGTVSAGSTRYVLDAAGESPYGY